jgi:acyl-CoA carboxylase subunit beta
MTALRSTLDAASQAYAEAASAMATKLADIDAEHAKALAGGGEKYVKRHHDRGKMTARERIEMLLDPDSPFLELSPLAAWGTAFNVGASTVVGIGAIEGVECLVVANDPTVKGGTSNPWTLKKILRANQIAMQNRLPVVSLVESGGADLPTQKEIFIPGGQMFRDLTRLSAAGIPTIALVFGNSTAGGAYIPGMSDHVVMIKERSKVFLAGPPLVKMATGEESDDESLGRRRDARQDFGSGGLLRRRRTRRHPYRPAHRRPAQLAQAGPDSRPCHRAAVRRRGTARHRAIRPAHPVRSPRCHRSRRGRLGVR